MLNVFLVLLQTVQNSDNYPAKRGASDSTLLMKGTNRIMRGILYANFVKAATWVGGDVPQWNHCGVWKVGRALYECAFWDLHKIMQYSRLLLVLLWTFLKILMQWSNAILPFTLMLFFAAGDALETSWWTFLRSWDLMVGTPEPNMCTLHLSILKVVVRFPGSSATTVRLPPVPCRHFKKNTLQLVWNFFFLNPPLLLLLLLPPTVSLNCQPPATPDAIFRIQMWRDDSVVKWCPCWDYN